MLALCWCRLLDYLRVQWKTYRAFYCWLVIVLILGAVLGIVTICIGDVAVDEINYNLIDGNILNATAIGVGMGSFIWQRILSLIVPVLVVLGLSVLSRLTSLIIFPVVLMHGYWLSVAVWWVFFYYSFAAILLLIFYLVWLLLVTAILLVGLIWVFQWGNHCRTCTGSRDWSGLMRGMSCLVIVAVGMGFFEYLVFCTILGKIVYKPI